jgi:hypothetical protein
MAFRESRNLNSPPDVPSIDYVQAHHDADDDPPRLADGRRILLRNVLLAMGAPFGFVMDVDTAMGARDHGLVVAEIRVVVILVRVSVVIPVSVVIHETRHRQLPFSRDV